MFLNQQSHKEKIESNNSIIIHFDRADFNRVYEMVKRFNEGKGGPAISNSHVIKLVLEG